MVYIFDTKLSSKNSVKHALTKVFGLGKINSTHICKKLGFSKNFKIDSLSTKQISDFLKICGTFLLEDDLKKFRNDLKKELLAIKSYKGWRRNKGLPVRGQRTHTNARTSQKVR